MTPVSFFNAPRLSFQSDGLDVLRAALAIWVLIAHAVPWAISAQALPPGFLKQGLDLLVTLFQPNGETHPAVLSFIVLSGYCIHRGGARYEQHFSLKRYAIRRAFRILPVYFLAVLAGLLSFTLASGIDPSKATALAGTEALSTIGIMAKLTGISVFVPSLHTASWQGNAPLTTVMVEIWLYALYGMVATFFVRVRKHYIWIAILFVAYMAGLIWTSRHPEATPWWHNGSLLSFAMYWWIGAGAIQKQGALPQKFWIIPACILLWALLTWAITHAPNLYFIEARKLIFACFVAWGIHCIDHSNYSFSRLLTQIGRSGYSIYAFHAPILIFLLIAQIPLLLALMTTLLIAMLSYWFYEFPMQKMGRRYAEKY